MKEALLHFIWKTGSYRSLELVNETLKLTRIEVLDPGLSNPDAGPDFFNAKIRIGNTIWAGNVEIHEKASMWKQHNHHLDPAYNSIILHVVDQNDEQLIDSHGKEVATARLDFDSKIEQTYLELMKNEQWISCSGKIEGVDYFKKLIWLEKLAVERILEKAERVIHLLEENKNDWQESFYIFLARSFGQNLNAVPFELMARHTPLRIALKNRHSFFSLEALFFGQAGFLSGELFGDEYYMELRKEYRFLQKKYKLKPIADHLWKFAKLRPSAFPTIRISQFAGFLFHHPNMIEELLELDPSSREAVSVFQIMPSEYWKNHYQFNKESAKRNKQSGKTFRQIIWLNCLIPFIFAYGLKKNSPGMKEKSLHFLSMFEAEKNSIIRKWSTMGIDADNALQSQALLQLKLNYCQKKRCLECTIGNEIIKNKTLT